MIINTDQTTSLEASVAEKRLREKQLIKFRDAAISIRSALTDTLKKLDDLCESLEIDLKAKPKVRRLTEKQLRHERCVAMLVDQRRKDKINAEKKYAKYKDNPDLFKKDFNL